MKHLFRILVISLACVPFAFGVPLELGKALGSDAQAYAKAMNIEFKESDIAAMQPAKADGTPDSEPFVRWFVKVPDVGVVNLRTADRKGAVYEFAVFFSDPGIATWRTAFLKMGIPTAVTEEKSDFITALRGEAPGTKSTAVTFKPIIGKSWRAEFFAPSGSDRARIVFYELKK